MIPQIVKTSYVGTSEGENEGNKDGDSVGALVGDSVGAVVLERH